MVDDALTGMTGYRRVRKRGAGPRSKAPADFEDRFARVIGPLGSGHYLVQPLGQPHAVITELSVLRRYAWFETEEDARRGTSSEIEGWEA